jgi:hypothetical protein
MKRLSAGAQVQQLKRRARTSIGTRLNSTHPGRGGPSRLHGVALPLPQISKVDAGFKSNGPPEPVPPPDPLIGEIDPEQSRRFTLGSAANTLWKTALSGDKAYKTVEGSIGGLHEAGAILTRLSSWVGPLFVEWVRHRVVRAPACVPPMRLFRLSRHKGSACGATIISKIPYFLCEYTSKLRAKRV